MKSALLITFAIVSWSLLVPNVWKKHVAQSLEKRTPLSKPYLYACKYIIENLEKLFLTFALVIAVARLTVPIGITSDASLQVGAALNFLSGDGFGNFILSEKVSETTILDIQLLTKFPPSLSVALAFLMGMGLSASWSLKAVYSISTLIGWLGWGLLLKRIVRWSAGDMWAGLVGSKSLLLLLLSVFLPLIFTPNWNGTDIFLWSGFPFFIQTLVFCLGVRGARRNFLLFEAGLLTGFLYSFRYAAMFLVIGFLIWLIRRPQQILQKGFCFLSGFCLLYAPISFYKKSASDNAFGSGSVSTETISNIQLMFEKLKLVLEPNAIREYANNFAVLLVGHLYVDPRISFIFGLSFAIGLALLVYALIKRRRRLSLEHRQLFELIGVSSCLIFGHSAILFLAFFLSFDNSFLFFTETRYYYPLFPLFLFLCFSITCFPSAKVENFASNLLVRNSFSCIQLAVTISIVTFLFFSFRWFTNSPSSIYGLYHSASPVVLQSRDSGSGLITRTPKSYATVMDLLAQDREAIAISYADDFDFQHVASRQIRGRISPAYDLLHWPNVEPLPWSQYEGQSSAGSHPVTAYLIFRKEANCESYCTYRSGEDVNLQAFSELHSAYFNPEEGIEILEGVLR